MSVEELQAAVAQLPAEELDRFSQWFEEFLADEWDRQIEADILAGRRTPPAAAPTRTSRPAAARRSPVNHFATPEFWFHYRRLPAEARELADRCFAVLQADPRHPSLRLKKVGDFWSARVGRASAPGEGPPRRPRLVLDRPPRSLRATGRAIAIRSIRDRGWSDLAPRRSAHGPRGQAPRGPPPRLSAVRSRLGYRSAETKATGFS